MTPVEAAFDWLEHTGLSLWVRGDSLLAFPLIISAHTLGMGFLAGTSSAIDLRILGVAKRVPLAAINVAVFYLSSSLHEVKALPAGSNAPNRAKLIAGTSLGAWIGVLVCGRLLTFFRPRRRSSRRWRPS